MLMSMETLPIINRTYDLYKAVAEIVTHMEKRWRYGIGQSTEKSVLDCLSRLIMAKNAPKPLKMPYLIEASSHLELTTLKLRLCLECKAANETQIFQTQALAQEIGRMLGGWIRSLGTP
jgi:hypothetical protein